MKYIEKFWTSSELFEYFKLSLIQILLIRVSVGGHILLKKNENLEFYAFKIVNVIVT